MAGNEGGEGKNWRIKGDPALLVSGGGGKLGEKLPKEFLITSGKERCQKNGDAGGGNRSVANSGTLTNTTTREIRDKKEKERS